MFTAFVKVNGQLRRWYEPLAPPNVISDHIPDLAGVFHADHPSSGDPDSPIDVETHHALVALVIFAVAFVFNMNAAMWSVQNNRCRLNLQVAYISAVAAWTHWEMYRGQDWYVAVPNAGARGQTVSFSCLRQLEWVFTTPILLLLVQNLHAYAVSSLPDQQLVEAGGFAAKNPKMTRSGSTYVPANRLRLVLADEVMILAGLLMPIFPFGAARGALLFIAMSCFAYIVYHSVHALIDITIFMQLSVADLGRLYAICGLKTICWSFYPAIYFLTEWGVIDCKTQHELYLFNDVLTKFSYTLMISAGSIRFIEVLEEHRAKVVIQMSQVQRSFFFNITHELRTPLNSIIGFNTLAMESGELTEFAESFIKASLTSAEALLGLINQILDFAKFEGAKDLKGGGASIELNSDVWTIRQLVEQVTDMTQKASVRGVDLVITLATPEHFNTKFVGDFFRLRQCCVNLVDNAIKYSSNVDGRTALVEFSIDVQQCKSSKDKNMITFSIADNGVGIPAAKQHTLFVPFCQPADHKTAKEKGTGLGLVITKSIIECLGGEIDFESEEDKGTRFFFNVEFARLNKRKHARANGGAESEVKAGGDKAGVSVALPRSPSSSSDEEDFIGADSIKEDALPPSARCIIHPRTKNATRRHVTSILKCFKGRAGVNYVVVSSEGEVEAKVRRASNLGAPIILVDVEKVDDAKEFITAHPDAGIILFGLPYQLIELHKRVASSRNVLTVLKPVKPSDLIDAVNKLVASHDSDAKWSTDPTPMDESRSSLDANEKLEIASALNSEAARMREDMYAVEARVSGSSEAGSEGSAADVKDFLHNSLINPPEFHNRPSKPDAAKGWSKDLEGMTVLLAEDNTMNQQMAKFSIEKCGAKLEIAHHGRHALECVRYRMENYLSNYDCILMDMMMPVMDGEAATRAIRDLELKMGRGDKRHVIVGLSANVGPEYTARVKAAGMDGSLSKPFYPATLRNTLLQVRQGTYKGFEGEMTCPGDNLPAH